MRRITVWILSTLSALVVLFSYHTSTDGAFTVAAEQSTSAPLGTTPDALSSTSQPIPTPTTVAADAAPESQTYTGSSVNTRYGPVQVEITVISGKITDVTTVEYPTSNGRDQQINSRAVPTLESETVNAQSADIHMVSGATYTSEGYVRSLQSAIDQANLA